VYVELYLNIELISSKTEQQAYLEREAALGVGHRARSVLFAMIHQRRAKAERGVFFGTTLLTANMRDSGRAR
jgi:hypothetical protein